MVVGGGDGGRIGGVGGVGVISVADAVDVHPVVGAAEHAIAVDVGVVGVGGCW